MSQKYYVCHRRGTAEQWASTDVKPLAGELVIEIDNINNLHKLKIGDGEHSYADLAYLTAGDDVVSQVLPRTVTVTLELEKWAEVTSPINPRLGYYCQEVIVDAATQYSRLDLHPDADMLAEFQTLNLVFVTENNGGTITVYSVGDMPLKTYTMQATVLETQILIDGDKIVGTPVGTPTAKSDWEEEDELNAAYILNKPILGRMAAKDEIGLTDLSEDVQEMIKQGGGGSIVETPIAVINNNSTVQDGQYVVVTERPVFSNIKEGDGFKIVYSVGDGNKESRYVTLIDFVGTYILLDSEYTDQYFVYTPIFGDLNNGLLAVFVLSNESLDLSEPSTITIVVLGTGEYAYPNTIPDVTIWDIQKDDISSTRLDVTGLKQNIGDIGDRLFNVEKIIGGRRLKEQITVENVSDGYVQSVQYLGLEVGQTYTLKGTYGPDNVTFTLSGPCVADAGYKVWSDTEQHGGSPSNTFAITFREGDYSTTMTVGLQGAASLFNPIVIKEFFRVEPEYADNEAFNELSAQVVGIDERIKTLEEGIGTNIPTVNNGVLTIKVNDDEEGTFSANQSQDTTINIAVPTKTSDLDNDSGYLTSYTETDPTVPNWAKAETKPTYSYDEITNKPTFATVATSGNYADLAGVPSAATSTTDGLMSATDKENLDVLVDSFSNDDSNTTIDTVKEVLKAFENAPEGTNIANALASKVDANEAIQGATKTKITYDSKGLVTSGSDLAASDIPNIDASKITSGTFADDRIASATTWNAKQDAISDLSTIRSGANAGASAVQPGDLAAVATSGSYNDLSNKPIIPTVNNGTLTIQKNGTDVSTFTANQSGDSTANIVVPTKTSELNNDSGFITSIPQATRETLGGVKVGESMQIDENGVIDTKPLSYIYSSTVDTTVRDIDENGIQCDICEIEVETQTEDGSVHYEYARGNEIGIPIVAGKGISIDVNDNGKAEISTTLNKSGLKGYIDTYFSASNATDNGVLISGDIEICDGGDTIVDTVYGNVTLPIVAGDGISISQEGGKAVIGANGLATESYVDTKVANLANKSDIPTVNNGTLTIQKNGTNVATFSANQSGNATANILVPTAGNGLSLSENTLNNSAPLYFVPNLSIEEAGSSTSGARLATKWAVSGVDGITTPTNGMTISIRTPNAGISGGVLLSIDNGATYYPLVRNVNSMITTHYGLGTTLIITFNNTQTASVYATSETLTEFTGCWQVADYDSNTKTTAGTSNKTGTKMYLVGGTSQSSSGVTTYSNKNVYIGTDNSLYSYNSSAAKSEKVATTSDIPTVPTKTSDLDNDNNFIESNPAKDGNVKTSYRIAKQGYTNGANWYYKLCTLPANNSQNFASIIISGRIGGWESGNMSYINALVWNRGTPGISVIDIAGNATAASNIWSIGDLALYVESDGSASLYILCKNYFTFDLNVEVYQSTASITYDGSYITAPTGTATALASQASNRLELYNNSAAIGGLSVLTSASFNYDPTTKTLTIS